MKQIRKWIALCMAAAFLAGSFLGQTIVEVKNSKAKVTLKIGKMNYTKKACRMHMRLFLDTKEVLQRLNRTVQAKQIKTDYRRQITDTRNRLERAQSMNSNLYNDYADGLLNERDYLFAK